MFSYSSFKIAIEKREGIDGSLMLATIRDDITVSRFEQFLLHFIIFIRFFYY